MESNFGLALLLTLLAGLATTVGSLIALFVRKPGPAFMSLTLGFSAGVMILVSFVELLDGGIDLVGFGPAVIAFFVGFLVIYAIDVTIPHHYIAEDGGETEPGSAKSSGGGSAKDTLMRTGMLVGIGIAIHNFPEGMATFASTLSNPAVGGAIAVAIAIHNIPEGIAVSVPVYVATGSRKKAFFWSFLSGISEPIGALLAALVLLPLLNDAVLGVTLSAVAGLMIFISLDELLPVSRSYGKEHLSIMGLAGGMAVMAFSLYLLR